jgi:branched-chain amino acid transport system permease protein
MELENKIPWWQQALQTGAIGGIVAVLAALIGMVESFHARDIIAGQISMGETLLLLIVVGFAYTASRDEKQTITNRILSGVITGVTTSALIVAFIMLGKAVNLRSVLVNASPVLYKIMTFDMESVNTAYGYILGIGALTSLVSSSLHALPEMWRRAINSGIAVVLLLALLQDLIRITLTPFPAVTEALAWMFGKRGEEGLSVIGAVVVFIVVTGSNLFSSMNETAIRARTQALPTGTQKAFRWASWALLAAFLLIWPRIAGPVLSDVTNTVGLYILMGLGLNIVVGYAGLLDLGFVAFYALGAFTIGVLTTTGGEIFFDVRWTFWQALPFAISVAVMAGIVLGIPVLKIRGDYLAIITLGFGEIIRIMFLSDFLKPYFGGSFGIVSIASPTTVDGTLLNTPQTLYYVILAACVFALFVAYRLRDSRIGRAWKAVREDEDVAQAMGINLTTTKLLAFATGAAFGGLSGAIFAAKLSTVYPHSFTLITSINVLALIIVGGMGSLPGVIVGGLLLAGLPELLREFSEFRLLIFGLLLIAMMLNKPEGFLPEAVHKREFHEDENLTPAAGE